MRLVFKLSGAGVMSMEKLSGLFFELSHEDRLGILYLLSENPWKLTQLASKLDCSSQEAYRHLSRLVDAGLSTKNSDGDYEITPYGSQVMNMVSGYMVLSKHSIYFKTRNLSLIPPQYTSRIGEISEAELVNDVMVTLFDMEVMINEAEEYIYIIIDQMVMNMYKPLLEATERGVKVLIIRPKGWELPDNIAKRIGRDVLSRILNQITKGNILQMEIEKVPVFLALSEKEVSALAFANLEDELDYLGFKSTDPATHNWCLELCNYLREHSQRGEVRTKIQ